MTAPRNTSSGKQTKSASGPKKSAAPVAKADLVDAPAAIEPASVEPFPASPEPIVTPAPEPEPEYAPEIASSATLIPEEATIIAAEPVKPVVENMMSEAAPFAAEKDMINLKGTTMADVIESTKQYTDEAKARFQSAFSELSEKAKAGVEKSTKAIEEMSDIAKGNVEALVESGKIAAKGAEGIGQGVAEYGRISFEKASATMKSFASVKSPAEFFQLQSELMSSSFDAFAKESAKSSEALLKLAGEIVQPLSTRVSIVTEKVKSLAS